MNINEASSQKQSGDFKKEQPSHQPRKRVDIVSIKLVKESSLLYKGRTIRSPQDGYELAKQYLGDVDREHFVVVCLDTKNNPTCINTCHIGSLNASIGIIGIGACHHPKYVEICRIRELDFFF